MKKILMLGWEYPPHISGGLGTACEGLTRALARQGVSITFIVPRLYGGEQAEHMLLLDPHKGLRLAVDEPDSPLKKISVPAFLKPYWTEQQFQEYVAKAGKLHARGKPISPETARQLAAPVTQYGRNICEEVARFSSAVVSLVSTLNLEFDLIHAHDWMTYPAGLALAQMAGKPLLTHVHSLEYDRSGQTVNRQIFDIEKMGVASARMVIAVSAYTRAIIARELGVPSGKIRVVHNGVYSDGRTDLRRNKEFGDTRIVLFLGRVTYQKGPAYFVEAAAKVIPHIPDALFVLAGSGDLLPALKARVAELGIGKNFLFPGFLKGRQVEDVFALADLYVMPSVSEPFGISALEAVNFETPALISRQSGVAEVLQSTLKFDFWDVERQADLIMSALTHPELRAEMVAMGKQELARLRWDGAARKMIEIYESV